MKVWILGAGAWGTALAMELSEGGNEVFVWGHDPRKVWEIHQSRLNPLLPGVNIPNGIQFQSEFPEKLDDTPFVIMAIPSKGLRAASEKLKQYRGAVVSVTKGIEHNSGLTMSQILREQIPGARVAVLSGPTFAPEIARRMPSAAVVASEDAATALQTQELFHRPYFRIYTNSDTVGVELGGALKNVIAIAAGTCDGLGFGDNSKAALVTRAIAEIRRLGVACGAQADTFAGLSGLGDLTVTCFSRQSRNRALGERIGRGEKIADILPTLSSVAEGYPTARSAFQLTTKVGVDCPIISEVHAVLYENKKPADALRDLVMRDSKSED